MEDGTLPAFQFQSSPPKPHCARKQEKVGGRDAPDVEGSLRTDFRDLNITYLIIPVENFNIQIHLNCHCPEGKDSNMFG